MRTTLARRLAAGLGGLGAVVFCLGIEAFPVWCHKPDGRIAVETEILPDECRCEKCLADHADETPRSAGLDAGGVSIRPLHCRHGRILSDTILGERRETRPPAGPATAAAPAASTSTINPGKAPGDPSSLEAPFHGPPPKAFSLLRC